MIEVLTRAVRRHFSGRESRYEFRTCDAPNPDRWPDALDLYVHVPFCRHLCPYCPYYKEAYDRGLIAPFVEAIKREIGLWARHTGRVRVRSLYIGGGTPMLLGDRLADVVDAIRSEFVLAGPVAIELNPNDVTDRHLKALTEAGVDMVSLGVQSFLAENLRLIGRPYGPEVLRPAIDRVLDGGFDHVNLDLMFALPGQRLGSLRRDIDQALASGAQQLTFYPLFEFPYTPVGRLRSLHGVGMPRLSQRRHQYRFLHETMFQAGLQRVSVWGFSRTGGKYSSVTRDCYIGLGPGAASCLPGQFLFNTFSLDHYQRRLAQRRFATALAMPLTEAMERYYWLYWRLYETEVPTAALHARFARDRRALRWLRAAQLGGLLRQNGQSWRLTERGAFWIHWMQNQFVLRYIDTVWRRALSDPFPEHIEL